MRKSPAYIYVRCAGRPGAASSCSGVAAGHWSRPIFLRFDLISSRSIKMRDSNYAGGRR